jgi:hypothetical protein
MRFKRIYSNSVDKSQSVRYDQIGKLEIYYPKKEYPDKLRLINYYDQEKDQEFIFLTNITNLTALEIAMLYKSAGK